MDEELIEVTIGTLMDRGLWDEATIAFGLEGPSERDDVLALTEEQARAIGL